MMSPKNRHLSKFDGLLLLRRFTVPRILRVPLISQSVIVCLLVVLIAMVGCTTARITKSIDYGNIQNYALHFSDDDFTFGTSVIERPEDPNSLMNRPFKEMGLLVFNIKMRNSGGNIFIINRHDICLFTKNGRKYVPLSIRGTIGHIKGPFGIYRVSFLGNISEGYRKYGIEEKICLYPGEEKKGYIFYKVEKEVYELAETAEIRVLFSRVKPIESIEHKLMIGEMGRK